MSTERQKYIDQVIKRLIYLKAVIEAENYLNLTNINVHSENFYRDFLNLLYGYKLVNINIVKKNSPGIDLGDEEVRIALQVTATGNLSKTRKTVKSFIDEKLYEKYDRLIIINITQKTNHTDEFLGDEDSYRLNTKEDIWDINDLVKEINDRPLEKIKEICNFLTDEISFKEDQTLAKEIQTFIALISYLSDESQPSAGNGFIEAPDPDGKINKRFADYADFLTKEYLDLYTEYGQVLADVMVQSDIGQTRIRRLGKHLKINSDALLNKHAGNARTALEELTESYKKTLADNAVAYDECAIKFFLVDQLIRCNVFPNKEE